ncbi:hypothetical protein LPJ61_003301 [Coemansia biformis]|uniref:Uncharacterized protein n=1 Tax=Coemansia biformis TaxID=1286918 RepID=A0A9W7Y6T3_9FUNG|nr:hypothetical protein LPJ61_003301 [Coemansia biformis]
MDGLQAIDEAMAERANDGAEQLAADGPPPHAGSVEERPVEERPAEGGQPLFVGLLPDEMSQLIRDGRALDSGSADTAAEAAAAVMDEGELAREAAALRTAEFVSDIVAALESGEAAQ